MASFDKFMKDLERRQALKKRREELLKKQDADHHHRRRVKLYSERWQNNIRYVPPRSKK